MKTIAKLNQQNRNETGHTPVQSILIPLLESLLPNWTFQPYGKDNAIACYPTPPRYTGPEAYVELNRFAIISSVCGPFYVVTQLRTAKPVQNETPDTITEAINAIVAILTQPVQYTGNTGTTTVALLREDCAFAVKQARFALTERDSLKALNAELRHALEDMLEPYEPADENWQIQQARSALARAKGQGV